MKKKLTREQKADIAKKAAHLKAVKSERTSDLIKMLIEDASLDEKYRLALWQMRMVEDEIDTRLPPRSKK